MAEKTLDIDINVELGNIKDVGKEVQQQLDKLKDVRATIRPKIEIDPHIKLSGTEKGLDEVKNKFRDKLKEGMNADGEFEITPKINDEGLNRFNAIMTEATEKVTKLRSLMEKPLKINFAGMGNGLGNESLEKILGKELERANKGAGNNVDLAKSIVDNARLEQVRAKTADLAKEVKKAQRAQIEAKKLSILSDDPEVVENAIQQTYRWGNRLGELHKQFDTITKDSGVAKQKIDELWASYRNAGGYDTRDLVYGDAKNQALEAQNRKEQREQAQRDREERKRQEQQDDLENRKRKQDELAENRAIHQQEEEERKQAQREKNKAQREADQAERKHREAQKDAYKADLTAIKNLRNKELQNLVAQNKAEDDETKQHYAKLREDTNGKIENYKKQAHEHGRGAGYSDDDINTQIKAYESKGGEPLRDEINRSTALAHSQQEIRNQLSKTKQAMRDYQQARISMVKYENEHGEFVNKDNSLANQFKQESEIYARRKQAFREEEDKLRALSRKTYDEDYVPTRNRAHEKVQLEEARHFDRLASGSRTRHGRLTANIDVFNALQQGGYMVAGAIESLNDVDRAITKVTKVVPDGKQAVNRWKRNLFKSASAVGKSAPEYASAVEQWATAGYNLKQSNYLAKRSVMGSFVGEVPVNDMVKYMAVPLNSYRKQHLKADDIINSMNQVSNKHAIEMDDLGQAYSKSAAVLSSNGTSFHQLTGMITGAQEATRAGGEVIGRSIKAIALNFSKMNAGVTKTDQSRAKFFKGLGVDLRDSNGKMKSTYQIMSQLAGKWKGLSKQQKQDAALYAAGKEHSAQFTGMLDNWKTVQAATADSEGQVGLGKHGSAYQEFGKQKKSIQFQLQTLQNTWQAFLQNLTGGREGITQMVSALNGLGQVAVKVSNNQGLMSAARWTAIGGAIMLARQGVKAFVNDVMGLRSGRDVLDAIVDPFKQYGNKVGDFNNRVRGLFGIESEARNEGQRIQYKSDGTPYINFDKAPKSERESTHSSKGRKAESEARTFNDAPYVDLSTSAHEKNTKALKDGKKAQDQILLTKKAANEMEAESAKTTAKSTSGLTRLKTKILESAQAGGRLGKVFSVGKSALGVMGAGLGLLGGAFDAVTIAGVALEAFGVHPMDVLNKAMHPAIANSAEFAKQMDKIHSSVTKANSAMQDNVVFNGTSTKTTKDIKALNKELNDAAKNGNQLSKGDWSKFKADFNATAKANGLSVRAHSNNVEVLKDQIKALQNGSDIVSLRQLRSGLNTLNKEERIGSKLNWNKSLQGKMVDSSEAYQNARKKLERQQNQNSRYSFNRSYGTRKQREQAQKDLRDRYSTHRALENTDAYQEWAANYDDYSSKVRGQYGKLEGALKAGIFGKSDFASMSNSQLRKVQQAQTVNAQEAARQSMLYKQANDTLAHNGKLTRTQQQALIKMNKGLEGISRDTTKWSADQRATFNNMKGRLDKNLSKQTGTLRDVMKSQGMSDSQINKKLKQLDGTGSGYLQVMGSRGASAQLLGVDADYQSLYGKHWYSNMVKQTKALEKSTKKDGSQTASAQALTNDDGTVNTGMVSRLDDLLTQDKKTTKFSRKAGLVDKNGNINLGKFLTSMKGLKGSNDPLGLLANLQDKAWRTKDKANASEYAKFLKNSGFKTSSKEMMSAAKSLAKLDGSKKAFKDDLKNQGFKDKDIAALIKGLGKNAFNGKDDGKGSGKGGGKGGNGNHNSNSHNNNNHNNSHNNNGNNNGNSNSHNNGSNSRKSNVWSKLTNSQAAKIQAKQFKSWGNAIKGIKNVPKNAGKALKGVSKSIGGFFSKIFKGARGKVENTAYADTRARTARQVEKNLGNKKVNSRQLQNLQKQLNQKQAQQLARDLNRKKQLTRSAQRKLDNEGKKYKRTPNTNNRQKMTTKPHVDKKTAEREGREEAKARQKGRDSINNATKAKEKRANTKAIRDAQKQGREEAKAKSRGATQGTSKAKSSNSTKNQSSAIKKLQSQMKSLGKGTNKIKITADTKGATSKIKSLEKSVKSIGKGNHKIKVTANVSGAKSKIKSLEKSVKSIGKGNHKVKVTATVTGKNKITSLKSALKGLRGKKVKVSASASGTGQVKSLANAIKRVRGKHVPVKANVSGTGQVKALRSAINSVHSKHVTVSAKVSGLGEVRSLQAAINALPSSKSVSINVNKNETHTITEKHVKKSKSVAIAPLSLVGNSPLTSASVATGDNAPTVGVDNISAMNGKSLTSYSDSTDNVNEDYWRYMGNELYTGLPLDEQVSKLENAVTTADDDMQKLINISKQRIDNDNKQIAYQKTMQGAYQQQITDMINQLHQYGFTNNGNQITNLNHAKDIHGDNASKVDDLLGKYQSAYQSFSETTKKIDELQTDIWQQSKNQNDYRNTAEQKMVEKLQRSLEMVTTAINNNKNILERQSNSLSDSDYKMKLQNSADQVYGDMSAVRQLLAEFNKMSITNFSTKENDNAKNLYDSLTSIRDSIMENLDAIDELKKSMRDTQISSIVDNLSKYTDNLNDSIDRLKNNVTNLQDGLISGTNYTDLLSSEFDTVNLTQKSAYEKTVDRKIELERELDTALDQFARKNIDRTGQVANAQLQIESQKYADLAEMHNRYVQGFVGNGQAPKIDYNTNLNSDQIPVPNTSDSNLEYIKVSKQYQQDMVDLKAKYNDEMAKAKTYEEKEAINNEMVYAQLAEQEKVYKSMIDTDKKAIEDLKKQASNPEMTTEQLNTINSQITEYEKNMIEAQNNIKEAIKQRFDYEKTLIDKQMDAYKRFSDKMANVVTIGEALNLDGKSQATLIGGQFKATYAEYVNYLNVIAKLREEMTKYDQGSYEYNQLDTMVKEYSDSLNSMVTSLMDINKNQFEQSLKAIQKEFEKTVNDGMTADQAKFTQDIWYNPAQKELKLEEMRLKIVELEDKTVEKKLQALEQEKTLSKAQADYVDKQLDLALAEQKLKNTENKRDVRHLEKDENGKFQWVYAANQDDVDAARQEVNQAKQALEEAKISNRNDYIQKVEEVVDNIKSGNLTQEEAKSELEQLNNSYKFILQEIPTFKASTTDDILKVFNEYEAKNKQILDDYKKDSTIGSSADYQTMMKEFAEQFKAVSADLGEIFGKEIRDALKTPNGLLANTNNGSGSMVIQHLNLELPNVSNAQDFADALKTLPQVARQYVTTK